MGLQSELPPHREVIETPSGITIGLLKELSELPPHREVIETPLKILHIFNALKSEPPPHREVIETRLPCKISDSHSRSEPPPHREVFEIPPRYSANVTNIGGFFIHFLQHSPKILTKIVECDKMLVDKNNNSPPGNLPARKRTELI